jgi:hypothetical protein
MSSAWRVPLIGRDEESARGGVIHDVFFHITPELAAVRNND